MQLAIWTDYIKTINSRSNTQFKSGKWTNYCYNQLQEGFQKACQYQVITSSPITYLIRAKNNKSHTVRLQGAIPIWKSHIPESGTINITCTCLYPDNYSIPCKHAIAALCKAGGDLESYYLMSIWYSISTYQKTYSFPIDPIQLEDFKDIELYISDNKYGSNDPFKQQIKLQVKAPKLAQLRGQPKKQCIRKASKKESTKQYRCSYYRQLGHNRKGYRNGQKEQKEEQEVEEVAISSSDRDKLA